MDRIFDKVPRKVQAVAIPIVIILFVGLTTFSYYSTFKNAEKIRDKKNLKNK